jgi:hypothetical protein
MACVEGELSAQQKAARIAWAIRSKDAPTSAQLQRLTGLSRSGFYALMAHLEASGGIPVRLCEDGRWRPTDEMKEALRAADYAF